MTIMTTPLDYERKPIEPRVPTSRAAVAGFYLGAVGPMPGMLLAMGADALVGIHPTFRLAVVMLPMTVGIALSVIGIRETASPLLPERGKGFAVVGLGFGIAWFAVMLLTFLIR